MLAAPAADCIRTPPHSTRHSRSQRLRFWRRQIRSCSRRRSSTTRTNFSSYKIGVLNSSFCGIKTLNSRLRRFCRLRSRPSQPPPLCRTASLCHSRRLHTLRRSSIRPPRFSSTTRRQATLRQRRRHRRHCQRRQRARTRRRSPALRRRRRAPRGCCSRNYCRRRNCCRSRRRRPSRVAFASPPPPLPPPPLPPPPPLRARLSFSSTSQRRSPPPSTCARRQSRRLRAYNHRRRFVSCKQQRSLSAIRVSKRPTRAA